jgi:hypothetical protein
MPVKMVGRKSFVKIFEILNGLAAFFDQLNGHESRDAVATGFSL